MSKFYLCVDIENYKTNKVETYYLVNEELEALLKYTSYCVSSNMLLNTLPNAIKIYIKSNSKQDNINFYYKKTKEGNSIQAVYSNDEDLLYVDYSTLEYLMFKNGIFISKFDVYENKFNPKVEEIYKLMVSLITKKELISIINYNFRKKFDSDKNLEYRRLDNISLWQKVALIKENSDLVIRYLCRDSYKKLVFSKKLKELLNKKLITNSKLDKNKALLKRKLKRKDMDYDSINGLMESEFSKKQNKIKEQAIISDCCEAYDPYEEQLINDEDMLFRYELLLSQNPHDEDLRLYIDAQKNLQDRKKRRQD